jgi:hypothetical protein
MMIGVAGSVAQVFWTNRNGLFHDVFDWDWHADSVSPTDWTLIGTNEDDPKLWRAAEAVFALVSGPLRVELLDVSRKLITDGYVEHGDRLRAVASSYAEYIAERRRSREQLRHRA